MEIPTDVLTEILLVSTLETINKVLKLKFFNIYKH